jgi:hypothetical protein
MKKTNYDYLHQRKPPTVDNFEIQAMTGGEAKATLSGLIMEQQIKRAKQRIANSKSNKKRYASNKELQAIKDENERLKKELDEIKQLKGFKESPQISEILSEMGDLDETEADKYSDKIESILTQLLRYDATESEILDFYDNFLKINGLKKPSSFNYKEQQRAEYKKIISLLRKEL